MKPSHVSVFGLCVPSLSSFHIPAFMKCYKIRYYRKHCLVACFLKLFFLVLIFLPIVKLH